MTQFRKWKAIYRMQLLILFSTCIQIVVSQNMSSEKRVCVSLDGGENSNNKNNKNHDRPQMVCTDQVLELRQQVDGMSFDTGVTQRIDGSETEKQAIRDVLQQMDYYFLTEVLALPQYEYSRSRCRNANELCAFWSSVGECESNRVFMLTNCPAACRFCLLLNSGLASS